MPWLALAALAASIVSGGSNSARRDPASPIDEALLAPSERDDLRAVESRHAHAVDEVGRLSSQMRALEADPRRSAFRVLAGLLLVIILFLGFLLATFVGMVLTIDNTSAFNNTLSLGLIASSVTLFFGIPFVRNRFTDRSEVLFELTSCAGSLALAKNAVAALNTKREDTRSQLHRAVDTRVTLRREAETRLSQETELALASARRMEALRALREQHESADRRRREDMVTHQVQAERAELVGFIKAAFTHWRTVVKNPDAYVAIHAARLVEQEGQIVAAHSNAAAMGATADECLWLAKRALAEFPGEVAYWMRKPADRTPEKVGYVFRRYTGDFRERLLPAAYRLLHERAHPVLPSSTPTPAPAAPPLATSGPMADLPPEEQREIAALLRDIHTLHSLDQVLELEAQAYEQRLRRKSPPLNDAQISRALEMYTATLDRLRSDWAASRGIAL